MKRNLPTVMDDLDQLFDVFFPFGSFLGRAKLPEGVSSRLERSGVSLYEDSNSYYIKAPVPGVKPENVKVLFENGVVMIDAKREEEKEDVTYHYRSSASYSYRVPLPQNVIDAGACLKAVCKEGLLKVTLPKKQGAKSLEISVQGE